MLKLSIAIINDKAVQAQPGPLDWRATITLTHEVKGTVVETEHEIYRESRRAAFERALAWVRSEAGL